MQKIQMVDLVGQYQKIKPEIDSAIQDVILQSAFINGTDVKEFRVALAEYNRVKHVIGCGNGTDALQIALMALGLQPGDAVIVPDFTFIATAEVVAVLGLKPQIIDVDPDTFMIQPENIEKAITPATKAIIPVHLFGQCAPMKEIMEIAKKHKLFVIEDTAQAIGAECQINGESHKAGTIGHIGCTSFFPSKNLGAFGDGGALFTNDNDLAEKIAVIANHGAKVKYYHDEVGINSRLDTLQAAILSIKLQHLDEYIAARQYAAQYYTNELKGIKGLITPKLVKESSHVFHQYTLRIKTGRDQLKTYLADKGIPSMVYYPVPMHRHKPYLTKGNFEISDMLCEQVLSLPMHTELDENQLGYICQTIKEYFRSHGE